MSTIPAVSTIENYGADEALFARWIIQKYIVETKDPKMFQAARDLAAEFKAHPAETIKLLSEMRASLEQTIALNLEYSQKYAGFAPSVLPPEGTQLLERMGEIQSADFRRINALANSNEALAPAAKGPGAAIFGCLHAVAGDKGQRMAFMLHKQKDAPQHAREGIPVYFRDDSDILRFGLYEIFRDIDSLAEKARRSLPVGINPTIVRDAKQKGSQ